MPTSLMATNDPLFDAIAMAYGANVRELRAAEKRFDEACARAVRALLPHAVAAANKAGLKILSMSEDASPWKNSGWYAHLCLGGDYARKLGKKDVSGVGLGIAYGHFFDETDYVDFGFYPYIWFWTTRKSEADTLRPRIAANLRSVCPRAERVRGQDHEIDLVLRPQANLAVVDQARSSLEALVAGYRAADAWMASKAVTAR